MSLASDAEDLKERLRAKLEEIYQNETRKTYVTKTEKVLTLLKKIQFVEVTTKFHEQISGMVEKKLSLSKKI